MHNEHRPNIEGILLIVDVDLRQILVRAFCGLLSCTIWDVDLSLNRLILVTCVPQLEVEFYEFFRVFWATFHGFSSEHA